jgi:hypothetical protein
MGRRSDNWNGSKAMSWFNNIRRNDWRGASRRNEGHGPPFPTLSTFLGIAAVMLALWLLASGLPRSLPPNRAAPSITLEPGATK